MTRLPLVFFVVALLATGTILIAEPPTTAAAKPDPAELLKQANAAAAKLNGLSYEAKFYGEGMLAGQVPPMDGKVLAKRDPAGKQHPFRVDGATADQDPGKKSTFSMAFDGKNVYSAEHSRKIFSSGPLADGSGVSNYLFQPKYLNEAPFDGELKNGELEYAGVQDVGGVACDVVLVRGKGARPAVTKMFLGKEDHLLRRAEATVQAANPLSGSAAPGAGTIVFVATSLVANPEIKDDAFRLECPPGYEKKAIQMDRPPQAGGQPQSNLLTAGTVAPEWELKTSDGKSVSLKGLRGKVVVLDFWATWCGPCKMAMPGIQKLHERFKDKPVAIYGVNCRERFPNVDPMAYIKEKGYTYGQLLKGDAVAEAYRVNGIPCIYIIDPEGKVLNALDGFNPAMEEMIAEIINKAIKK